MSIRGMRLAAVLCAGVCFPTDVRPAEKAPDLVIADFESIDDWRGLELDQGQFKEGRASGLWRNMPERSAATLSEFPHDWSRHGAVSFWMHNARNVDARVMLILRSENPATEGEDYYGLQLRLDRWTGWKELIVPFSEFGAAREPLGWSQIQRITFTASGWDNQPSPDAEVRLDDFGLVAIDRVTGPRMSDEELLDAMDLERADMAAVKAAVERKDVAAAKVAWLEHLRSRQKPVWTVDWRERPSRNRTAPAGESPGRNFSAAEQVVKHVMQGHNFGPDIDWTADPNHYREWTYSINRFFHWRTLAEAYWEGGVERFARELCVQWVDWVRKNPVPLFNSGNSSYTWRTIECGIRQSTTWPDSLYRVLDSPHF
ncbi:MAG: heparinase II/III family protein, partial [Thermoguttaceae bacterium]